MKDVILPKLLDLLSQIDEGIRIATKQGDAAAVASLLNVKLQALHLWNT